MEKLFESVLKEVSAYEDKDEYEKEYGRYSHAVRSFLYRRDTGKIPPFKVGYESVSNLNFSN
jgi:hypothetical protein